MKSPVGSSVSFFPLRIHVRTSTRSLVRSSGDRRVNGTESVGSNAGGSSSSSGVTPTFLIQSIVPSISRARSSGDCLRLAGSIWSIFLNSPVGSSDSGLPWRIQVRMSSVSFFRASGVRREIGMDPTLLKAGESSSDVGFTPLLRIQSSAPSISFDLSSGVWPFFFGNSWSIFLNSPVGSRLSLLLLLIHVNTLSVSFCLSSGVRFEIGIECNLSNFGGNSSSSGDTSLFLIQSMTPSMSRALASGVCFFLRGSS
mmetsp:Transcript_7515/g.11611  ORF Transcript_7515/g.11611 Transcript_7515/m.11611 type:complete len:255 (+) Transcript_7515:214-978(+)